MSLEQLELRTVMSATNPVATASELQIPLLHDTELHDAYAAAFPTLGSQETSQRQLPNQQFDEPPAAQDPLPGGTTNADVAHQRRRDVFGEQLVPSTRLESSETPDVVRPLAPVPPPWMRELDVARADIRTGMLESIETRADWESLMPPFSRLAHVSDSVTRTSGATDPARFLDFRSVDVGDHALEQTAQDHLGQRLTPLTDGPSEGGLIDIAVAKLSLASANHEGVLGLHVDRTSTPPRDTTSSHRGVQPSRFADASSERLGALVTVIADSTGKLSLEAVRISSDIPSGLRKGNAAAAENQVDRVPQSAEDNDSNKAVWRRSMFDGPMPAIKFESHRPLDPPIETIGAFNGEPRPTRSVDLETDKANHVRQIRRRSTSPLPEDESWWQTRSRRAHDSYWLDFSGDIDSRLATYAEPVANPPGSAPPDADPALDSQHGGMIELMATAWSDASFTPRAHDSDAVTRSLPLNGAPIQIDTQVDLFQAFELANFPTSTDQSDSVLTIVEAAWPGAIAADTEPGMPPSEGATAVFADVRQPTRAAWVPALLVTASFLLSLKGRRLDEALDLPTYRDADGPTR